MAKSHSYTITLRNNKTENEALNFVLDQDESLLWLDKEGRKKLLEKLGIEKKYSRAFDLVQIEDRLQEEVDIKEIDKNRITLIELKTTKKQLKDFPKGFFFGATQNEFDLANKLGERYKFCFISLHPESKGSAMCTSAQLNKMIKTKRVQYQINL